VLWDVEKVFFSSIFPVIFVSLFLSCHGMDRGLMVMETPFPLASCVSIRVIPLLIVVAACHSMYVKLPGWKLAEQRIVRVKTRTRPELEIIIQRRKMDTPPQLSSGLIA
jgi:hypothetical protein